MSDPGLFGPDSVAWRIHADPVTFVGGLRALLVQALEPRAMAGVEQHSEYRSDPWGRLQRTIRFVQETTFGDTATAEAACARVRHVHEHVHGVDPVTGCPYRASDPDLVLWIHAVEVHSLVVAYRAYAGRLSREDADRYVGEMTRIAERVELPEGLAPRTFGELEDYLDGMRGRLQMTEAARAGMRTLVSPPMPLALRPLWLVPVVATVAILPEWARRLYRLPWTPLATWPTRINVHLLSRAMNVLVPRDPIVREARARVGWTPTGPGASPMRAEG